MTTGDAWDGAAAGEQPVWKTLLIAAATAFATNVATESAKAILEEVRERRRAARERQRRQEEEREKR